jgi:dihydrofolate synthase/folylpolyglutamate synthase
LSALLSPPNVVPWRLPTPDTNAQSASYRRALDHIYEFSERPRTPAETELGRQRKLDRMRVLLDLLGAPQDQFAAVLVAGTKGKGSMAAYLTAMLAAAGYRAGRFTQPHLYSYRERIWAAGDFVTEAEVADLWSAMEEALARVSERVAELGPLTTFDVGAAQAILHFARAGVDIAVVEVGVGGAHDATNVLDPILALIGPIGLDHMATLGPTIRHIAREKAGVMRPGRDVVVGAQEADAMAVLEQSAAEAGARLHLLGRDVTWHGPACGDFSISWSLAHLEDLSSPLQGECQRDNAATAIAAAALLGKCGFAVPESAMRAGVANISWPGRFQTIVRAPLTIVDGAHNETSARALRACLSGCHPGRQATVVLGMSTEKDAVAFVRELAPVVARVIVTRARHARAADPEVLASTVRARGIEATIVESAPDAVMRAWDVSDPDDLVVVTGSLFLVGDVLEWMWPAQQPSRAADEA